MHKPPVPRYHPRNILKQKTKQTLYLHDSESIQDLRLSSEVLRLKKGTCAESVQADAIQETPEGRMQHILLPTWFRKYQKSWLSWGPVVEKGTCAESASRRHNANKPPVLRWHPRNIRRQNANSFPHDRKYQDLRLSWGPVVENAHLCEAPVPRNIQETSENRKRKKLLPTWFRKYPNSMALKWGPVVEKGTCAESASRRHNAQATCPEKHPRNIRRQNAKHYSYLHDSESINIYGSREVLWLKRELARNLQADAIMHEPPVPKRHPRNIRRQNTKHTLTDMIQKVSKLWLSWGPVVEKGTCAESASRRHNAEATCPEIHPRNLRRQNAKRTLFDMIQKVSKFMALVRSCGWKGNLCGICKQTP